MQGAVLGALVLLLAGCASPKPVLYPNAHYEAVGADVAERDIAACREMADAAGAAPEGGRAEGAARGTVTGGAIGAGGGAVGGAIRGGAGTGAAIGAATGATVGLLHSLVAAPKPSAVHMNFVDRCLRERGYEPVGWR